MGISPRPLIRRPNGIPIHNEPHSSGVGLFLSRLRLDILRDPSITHSGAILRIIMNVFECLPDLGLRFLSGKINLFSHYCYFHYKQ